MVDKNLRPAVPVNSSDVLEGVKKQTARAINCIKIGVIDSFDPSTQLANITLSMKQVESIYEDGTRVLKEYPLLMECPVVVLFGGLDAITMPIVKGDTCMVMFNDNEIDQWLNNGNGQTPLTLRMHDLSDAFALVGIRSLTQSIGNYLANGIRLSHNNGATQLDLKDGLIELIAGSFLLHGSMHVTGGVTVDGAIQGATMSAGNGATGSFGTVTVVNGIVTGGSS